MLGQPDLHPVCGVGPTCRLLWASSAYSWMKRCNSAPSSLMAVSSTLSASWRWSDSLTARNTSDMPPLPILRKMR